MPTSPIKDSTLTDGRRSAFTITRGRGRGIENTRRDSPGSFDLLSAPTDPCATAELPFAAPLAQRD
ncbi:hypothetical protein GCM10023214_22350 [Amycolatopsis dongchuanensis]|uniref:Uncharacterized protein n=1 Tax=Amycolatopsis dongchuanensis TaxID=1070866 RepID=A0ABP9QCM2_9PSEU